MKKLMITVAAIATGVMAWAGSLSNVFDASKATDLTGWSGATDKAVLEDNLLKIKTGSVALSRDISPAFAVTDNIYFDVSLDVLGQALDEVPAVADDAKLALFLLDGTEIEGAPTGVSLYAIAKNPAGGKMLFKLNASTEDVTRVTVKGYRNVMKSGTENAGFMVYLKGGETEGTVVPLRILAAYAIAEDGTVDWSAAQFNSNTYLKDAVITPLTQKRENVLLALLSGVDGQSFAAMDFVGNANISKVEMNDTGFDFIPGDLQSAAITLDGVSITVDPAEAYLAEEGLLIADCTITATATSAAKPVIKGNANVEETADGVFSYTFVSGKDVTLTAYELAATAEIDGVTKKYTSLAEALDDIQTATTASVKLFKSEEITMLATTGEVTIDLNGQALTGNGGDAGAVIYAGAGALTITDTVGTGSVQGTAEDIAAVRCEADATVAINAGIFKSAIVDGNDPVATVVTGGKFAGDPTAFVDTKTYDVKQVGGYYEVTEHQATVVTVTVNQGAGTTLTVEILSEGKATEGDTLTITASAETGYEDLVVTVNGEAIALTDGSATVQVGTDNLVIASSAKKYVAQIGENKYESLAAAVAAAKNGDTVTVLADITTTEAIAIAGTSKADYAITIENDYNVTWTADAVTQKYAITVNGATVTFTGTGTWTKTAGTASLVQAGATAAAEIIVTSGTFVGGTKDMTGSSAPSNLITSKWGDITVNGGTFVNYRADQGRCVCAEGSENGNSKLTVNDGTFEVRCDGTELTEIANRHVAVDNKGLTTGSVVINGGKFKTPEQNVNEIMNAYCGAGYKLKADAEGWLVKTAIVYATLTVNIAEQVSGVVVKAGEAVVKSGDKFDVDEAVVVTADLTDAVYAKGYEADADNSVYEVTMTGNATITVAAKKSTYAITVTDGTADKTSYQISDVAQTVTLTAGNAPEGKKFKQWKLTEKAGVSIAGNTLTIDADTIGEIAVAAEFEDEQTDLPGAGDVPAENKAAYNTWAQKNGVVAGDSGAGAELATAWAMGVDGAKDAADVEAKAEAIVTAQVTQALVDAIVARDASTELAKIATTLGKNAAVTVTLEPVNLTGSDATLFKLKVTIKK